MPSTLMHIQTGKGVSIGAVVLSATGSHITSKVLAASPALHHCIGWTQMQLSCFLRRGHLRVKCESLADKCKCGKCAILLLGLLC